MRGPEVRGLRVAVHGEGGNGRGRSKAVAATWRPGRRSQRRTRGSSAPRHPGGGHDLTLEVWRSYGDEMTAAELYALLRRWDSTALEMLAWFADRDLVLCPVFPEPARRHGDMNRPRRARPHGLHHPLQPHGLARRDRRALACCRRVSRSASKLVAHPGRDDVALAAAAEVERALGGYRPPPLQPQPGRARSNGRRNGGGS